MYSLYCRRYMASGGGDASARQGNADSMGWIRLMMAVSASRTYGWGGVQGLQVFGEGLLHFPCVSGPPLSCALGCRTQRKKDSVGANLDTYTPPLCASLLSQAP